MCFRLNRLLPGALLPAALAAALSLASPRPIRADALQAKTDEFVRHSVKRAHGHGRVSVILKLDGELHSGRATRLHQFSADIYRRLGLIDSVAVSVPVRNVDKLAA